MIPIGMAREHKLRRVEPVPITAEDGPDFLAAVGGAFHAEWPQEMVERIQRVLEPERALVIRDRGRIVAATAIYSRTLTVPGGELPLAAVTLTGVLPTHRRRGLLTALMRRQLADVRGREAVAALWASEGAIYGRFGYGMATLAAELDVAQREADLHDLPDARPELKPPSEAIDALRPIHDAVRRTVPGMLGREGLWWEMRIADPEHNRHGAGPLRAAVVDGEAYALYATAPKFEGGRPGGDVLVREVVAASPEGYAAIWGFLLGLDLMSRLVYLLAPSDDPLFHLVTEAQAVRMRVGEALWVRLVDLPRALRERTYAEPFETVLEVADAVCRWNAGRWALRWDGETATCAATSLPAALELSAAELGAAYLGGTTLEMLARAGRVRELRSGALAAASRAFRGDRAPWCPEIF
jgi:predicted acetyltransferase